MARVLSLASLYTMYTELPALACVLPFELSLIMWNLWNWNEKFTHVVIIWKSQDMAVWWILVALLFLQCTDGPGRPCKEEDDAKDPQLAEETADNGSQTIR